MGMELYVHMLGWDVPMFGGGYVDISGISS